MKHRGVSQGRRKRSKQLDVEIAEVLAGRGPVAHSTVARYYGVEPSVETKQDVLRELNGKYGTDVREPWRMLAHLRRGAERLMEVGRGSSDRYQELVRDHARLRRAPDDFL